MSKSNLMPKHNCLTVDHDDRVLVVHSSELTMQSTTTWLMSRLKYEMGSKTRAKLVQYEAKQECQVIICLCDDVFKVLFSAYCLIACTTVPDITHIAYYYWSFKKRKNRWERKMRVCA